MKIEIAQITTDPGNIEDNTRKIISTIEQARQQNADLVVFHELAITGYSSMDLFLRPSYLRANALALDEIVRSSKGIAAIVGFVDFDEKVLGFDGTSQRFNAAAIIENGRLVDVVHKTLLPTYDVFDENRYFTSGNGRKVVEINGKKLGIEICEDAWDENYSVKVSQELVRKGAEILVNISGSPFYVDKRAVRQELIGRHARKLGVPFIYANLVGTQDGYEGELVFDGQSMILDKTGRLISLGKAFQEDLIEVDLDKENLEINLPSYHPTAQLFDALIFGIRGYFQRIGQKKAWIGLSGGIDSAVVAVLVKEALGAENVTGISMPSQFSSQGSRDDAVMLAKNLGINFMTIPIIDSFNAYQQMMEPVFKGLPFDTTEENMQARIRGNILMGLSNKFGGLVISTGNKTEMAVGYCTLYGDMSGGLAAIADVSKLKVYDLARYINRRSGLEIIPESTITKAPSAELKVGQTDEASIGIPYEILSPLVDEIIASDGELAHLVGKYQRATVLMVNDMMERAEFKRRQSPAGIKVTPRAFGIGRRLPIAHKYKEKI